MKAYIDGNIGIVVTDHQFAIVLKERIHGPFPRTQELIERLETAFTEAFQNADR